MKRFILITLSIIAFIFAIGTLGAYDKGNIGFIQLLIQSAICVAIEWFSLKNADL
jgi:hypothetical protein